MSRVFGLNLRVSADNIPFVPVEGYYDPNDQVWQLGNTSNKIGPTKVNTGWRVTVVTTGGGFDQGSDLKFSDTDTDT